MKRAGSLSQLEDRALQSHTGRPSLRADRAAVTLGNADGGLVSPTCRSIGWNVFDRCERLTHVYFLGNAPSPLGGVFSGTRSVVVYHLANTEGWDGTFDGQPTEVWTAPVMLEGSLGVNANAFGFVISWAPDVPVVVEASTTLTNPSWSSVTTNILTGGVSLFTDPDWRNHPTRFYRLALP